MYNYIITTDDFSAANNKILEIKLPQTHVCGSFLRLIYTSSKNVKLFTKNPK